MVFRLAAVCAITLLASLAGCKKSKPDPAAELAKWRADQKRRAIEQYKNLIQKFPESEYADKAKERIQALQASTPQKK
jgi:geranylgeranyl pyrophosphate synthase